MNKQKWWNNPNNAKEWINQVQKHKNDLTYTEQPDIVIKELSKHINKFDSIMEVGSGTGHLIGNIKNKYPEKDCIACDINSKLLEWVMNKYPQIDSKKLRDITLGIECVIDDKPDLIFTYQVLQHIHPDNIRQALNNLLNSTKKELWMWEGIGKLNYKHMDKTHNAHDGSWVYHINEMLDCYEVSIPQNNNIKLDRQRLYKIKI